MIKKFIKDNQKQFNQLIKNYEFVKEDLEEVSINSFRNEINKIPSNKKDLELLKIQYLVNEFHLESINFKISQKTKTQLEKLNKYF